MICGLCLGLSLLVRKTKVVDDDGRAVSTDTLPSTSTDYCGCRCITRVLAAAVFCVSSVLLVSVFLKGTDPFTSWCPWCKYLSCVPSPWWECPQSVNGTNVGSGGLADNQCEYTVQGSTLVMRCPDGTTVSEPYSPSNPVTESTCKNLCKL